MSFYFTLLYITLLYFELRWQHIPCYTMLYYLWYKIELNSTIQYHTILNSTILYYIKLS